MSCAVFSNVQQAGALELDRIKLAVHEALLERHDRELAPDLAKARHRPLLGCTDADAKYELEGTPTVTGVVSPPTTAVALTVAKAHRAYRDRLAHIIGFESGYWRTLIKHNAAVGLKAYDPDKAPTVPVRKVPMGN
jgi:hypothetical protein